MPLTCASTPASPSSHDYASLEAAAAQTASGVEGATDGDAHRGTDEGTAGLSGVRPTATDETLDGVAGSGASSGRASPRCPRLLSRASPQRRGRGRLPPPTCQAAKS